MKVFWTSGSGLFFKLGLWKRDFEAKTDRWNDEKHWSDNKESKNLWCNQTWGLFYKAPLAQKELTKTNFDSFESGTTNISVGYYKTILAYHGLVLAYMLSDDAHMNGKIWILFIWFIIYLLDYNEDQDVWGNLGWSLLFQCTVVM